MLVYAYNSTDGYVNCIDADSFKKYFLPRVKLKKNWNWWMKFCDQPMTQLNNTMKSEKYQQEKVIIIQLVFIGFCLFWKKLQISCSWFK